MKYIGRLFILLLLSTSLAATNPLRTYAADYVFPVIGDTYFSDDFLAPRSYNGIHHATDIFAEKMQKVVSRTDGVITFAPYPEPSWGYGVGVKATNGYDYWYIHLNNDSPGTDDGRSDANFAYGPDIVPGKQVVKGQLLGYVGDSGNAEDTPPHLHLEIIRSDDSRVNPYSGLLNNSEHISRPVLTYPIADDEIIPSSRNFTGGYSIALGDIDGDDTSELITGPGPGGKQLKVLSLDGNLISKFQPNGNSFLGGFDVATGDIDGDGSAEIITGAGPGGKLVKVFEPDGTLLHRFQPNGSTFLGGIDVATGDIDGDGSAEIITGAGPGGKLVKVFEPDGTLLQRFSPYFTKIGVSVTTSNFDDDAADEIVTGARKGGGPRVNVYDSDATLLQSHYVYRDSFKGGIRVETGEVNSDNPYDEIITISQQGGTARTKVTTVDGTSLGYTNYFAEEYWKGYHDIAADRNGNIFGSMGIDRRSTIRQIQP